MKVIIAGGRDFTNTQYVRDTMDQLYYDELAGYFYGIDEVVSGGARGADREGEQWALNASLPVKEFPANWDFYGAGAGPRRNEEMAEYADVLVAFWDGKSKGTGDMIRRAIAHGLEVHIYRYTK